jgi:MFS family permease
MVLSESSDVAGSVTDTSRSEGGYAWYIAGVLAIAYLVSILDRYLMSVALAPIKQQMALSDTQLAMVHTVGFAVLYTFVSIPIGHLADLVSRRALIATGIVLWSASTAACGFANEFWGLVGARVGVGIGEAVLMPAGMSLLASYFRKESMGRATAVFTSGAVIGSGVALIGGGYLFAHLTAAGGLHLPVLGAFAPWQVLFLIGALPGIVVAVLMLTVREPVRKAHAQGSTLVDAAAHLREHIGSYAAFMVPFIACQMLQASLTVWGVVFLSRGRDFAVGDAAIAAGVVAMLAGPAGMWVGGFLHDLLTRKGIPGPAQWVISGGLVLCILPAVSLALTDNLIVAIVSLALVQFLGIAGGPAAYAAIPAIAPEQFRGLATSIMLGVASLGALVMGLLSDRLFSGVNSLNHAFLVLAMSLCAVGLVSVVLTLYARTRTNTSAPGRSI